MEIKTTPTWKYQVTPPQRGINGGQVVHRPTEDAGVPSIRRLDD